MNRRQIVVDEEDGDVGVVDPVTWTWRLLMVVLEDESQSVTGECELDVDGEMKFFLRCSASTSTTVRYVIL